MKIISTNIRKCEFEGVENTVLEVFYRHKTRKTQLVQIKDIKVFEKEEDNKIYIDYILKEIEKNIVNNYNLSKSIGV